MQKDGNQEQGTEKGEAGKNLHTKRGVACCSKTEHPQTGASIPATPPPGNKTPVALTRPDTRPNPMDSEPGAPPSARSGKVGYRALRRARNADCLAFDLPGYLLRNRSVVLNL
jgi:hypothetical protein